MNAHESISHERAAELLPWLVNDSLEADAKDSVLAHARACVICRRDLHDLQQLRDAISRMPASIPAPDMRNINARIDALIDRRERGRRLLSRARELLGSPWQIAFAAQSILLIVLAVVLMLPASDEAHFTTLTAPEELPDGSYMRVVFSPELDSAGLSGILEQFDLEVVDGPTSRGVYTLGLSVSQSAEDRNRLLSYLQQDRRILFAQPLDRGPQQ